MRDTLLLQNQSVAPLIAAAHVADNSQQLRFSDVLRVVVRAIIILTPILGLLYLVYLRLNMEDEAAVRED